MQHCETARNLISNSRAAGCITPPSEYSPRVLSFTSLSLIGVDLEGVITWAVICQQTRCTLSGDSLFC